MRLSYNALPPTFFIAIAIAIGGCGLSSSSSSSGKNGTASNAIPTPVGVSSTKLALPNACDVLDEATAKKYLGGGAQLRRKAQPNPHESQCQYASANGVVTIMVGEWKFVHTLTPLDKSVSGFGDEAYETPSGLNIRKGDLGISVNVIVASGEFWGKAADDINDQTSAAQRKIAPDLLTRL